MSNWIVDKIVYLYSVNRLAGNCDILKEGLQFSVLIESQ